MKISIVENNGRVRRIDNWERKTRSVLYPWRFAWPDSLRASLSFAASDMCHTCEIIPHPPPRPHSTTVERP